MRPISRTLALAAALSVVAALGGCAAGVNGGDASSIDTTDAGETGNDAGLDAGASDAGGFDAGEIVDAGGFDAGGVNDAGEENDAGERRDGGDRRDAGDREDAGERGDAGDCDGGCSFGRMCCSGECINPANDPENCGTCGTRCMGSTPYCNNTCQPAPCSGNESTCAADGGTCCGSSCCGAGQLCCDMEGPVAGEAACYTPTTDQPTCPQGCAPLCVSDREAKRDIEPVDDRAVLESLMHVPVSSWVYKNDGAAVRHVGPMAQDLHAAFGLGGTDKAYDPVDAHGIAFSSIRALYQLVQAQDVRIEKLERENAELRARMERRHR